MMMMTMMIATATTHRLAALEHNFNAAWGNADHHVSSDTPQQGESRDAKPGVESGDGKRFHRQMDNRRSQPD